MTAFADLATNLKERRAANPVAYDRARKARRRLDWELRAGHHDMDGKPTRDVLIEKNPEAEKLSQGSHLDKREPLNLPFVATARPERGQSMIRYYIEKFQQEGTIGTNAALNPLWDLLRTGKIK